MENLLAQIDAVGADVLAFCTAAGFIMLVVAFFLTVLRLVLGPTTSDRVLSLDFLFTLGVTFIAIFIAATHRTVYLDIAIALGLVGFLATVAYARFVFWHWRQQGEDND